MNLMQPRPGLKGNKVFSIIKVKFLIRWAVIASQNLSFDAELKKYRFANKFKQFSTCVNKSHFSQWLIEFTNM
ncbi:unnamed protein product [Brugia timori]|uniref:Uncharacterized protein n=1 Tax=Brugia timori TaxID=42155 RepID=A0A0R3QLF4_9BILA|nr:unnamed protein product [Brugia timori]